MASNAGHPLSVEAVIALAEQRPWAGQPWARELLEAYPGRLRAVLARWQLTPLAAHLGAGLPVLEVDRRGEPAVLKFSDGGTDVAQQARVLEAADGRGCVRLLAHEVEHEAILLERLGPTLADTVADEAAQVGLVLDLLPAPWALPAAVGLPYAPDHKARNLLRLLENAPPGHDATCQAAHGLATWLAENPGLDQVVVHGDPHASNVLGRGDEHVLIDPDGFLCEPEYDVGVVLRDQQRTIDRLDREQGVGAGARWHADLVTQAARRTGLDARRIAAWAAVERVTTGIHLGNLGFSEESQAWLSTAARVLLSRG